MKNGIDLDRVILAPRAPAYRELYADIIWCTLLVALVTVSLVDLRVPPAVTIFAASVAACGSAWMIAQRYREGRAAWLMAHGTSPAAVKSVRPQQGHATPALG